MVPVPSTPLGVFQLFFTDDLLKEIASESNLYAKQVLGEEAFKGWQPVSKEELKAFIGFCLLMGISRLPAIEDYWKRNRFLRYAPIADRISRQRFRDVFRFMHFTNNKTLVPRGVDRRDRLGKVRPLIKYLSTLSSRLADVYHPHCEVPVDEQETESSHGQSFHTLLQGCFKSV